MGASGEAKLSARLNATERDILQLLGAGHTAKSIATLRGLSVAAVNERLRSARRKTGVGSSRELARLLTAQENRDDFIGLADAQPTAPASPRPDARRSPPASAFRRWRLPMATAAVLAAALLLAQQTSTTPAQLQDGLVADILSRQTAGPDVAALNSELSAIERDAEWSPRAEALLGRRYEAVPTFERDVASLQVRCSASLCEAVGVMRDGIDGDALTETMSSLQRLEAERGETGLNPVMHHFSTSAEGSAFIAYWRRAY